MGQRPLAPSSSLEMVLICRWIFPSDGRQGGGNFVVPNDLGFLSLYRISDFRHPDYVFSKTGFEGHTNSDWAELYIENHQKNSLQLCSFKFFRLRSSSGVSEAISCLVGTDFGKVRVQLQQGSFCVFFLYPSNSNT